MNGKEIVDRLKKHGWKLNRINGSHHIMEHPKKFIAVPVPVHGKKDLGIGLVKKIEKQTGVKLL